MIFTARQLRFHLIKYPLQVFLRIEVVELASCNDRLCDCPILSARLGSGKQLKRRQFVPVRVKAKMAERSHSLQTRSRMGAVEKADIDA